MGTDLVGEVRGELKQHRKEQKKVLKAGASEAVSTRVVMFSYGDCNRSPQI